MCERRGGEEERRRRVKKEECEVVDAQRRGK